MEEKTTSTGDDLNGRWPQQKWTSMEDYVNKRWPQRKMSSSEDDLTRRVIWGLILKSVFLSFDKKPLYFTLSPWHAPPPNLTWPSTRFVHCRSLLHIRACFTTPSLNVWKAFHQCFKNLLTPSRIYFLILTVNHTRINCFQAPSFLTFWSSL